MTNKSKKEVAILFVLIVLLCISIYSQTAHDPQTIVSVTKRTHRIDRSASSEVIQSELLENKPEELSEVKRNIFQFGGRAAAPEVTGPKIQIPQTQPSVPEPPAMPEVHYLGFYLEKGSGLKLAALSNSGKIYVGKVGQVLGGKYQVLEIEADHVLLKLLTQDGKLLRVPLGKQPASFVGGADDDEGDESGEVEDDDEDEDDEEDEEDE
jgi:hypothetical protein